MGKQDKNTHIGSMIREQIHRRGMTYAEFARRLNCDRTTVYSIVRSQSIDTERLRRISQILEYDFFKNAYLQDDSWLEIELPDDVVSRLRDRRIDRITIRISSCPSGCDGTVES